MSSQAEKIKQFKHAQHHRLHKVDDEDYISSEELCTEGSSDEDVHIKSKLKNRKKKACISPLALPNKAHLSQRRFSNPLPERKPLSGSSKTVRFLPDITASEASAEDASKELEHPMELLEKVKISQPESGVKSKNLEKTKSLEESIRKNIEMDKADFWRPKRGSISLPITHEDGNFARKLMYEINDFYIDMLNDLRVIKGEPKITAETKLLIKYKPDQDNLQQEPSEADTKLTSTSDESFAIWKEDPEVIRQLSVISSLDEQILSSTSLLKDVVEERQVVEDEMCSLLSDSGTKESVLFLELCQFAKSEHEDYEEANDPIEPVSNTKQDNSQKQHNQDKYEKDFVRKNIELAKDGMGALCLTDEEKIKLENLLADLESIDDAGACEEKLREIEEKTSLKLPAIKEAGEEEYDENESELDNPLINGFKLHKDEIRQLDELDLKLNKLIETMLPEAFLEETPNTDDKKREGKLWKEHLMDKRLKEIDKQLEKLQLDKMKEKRLKELQKDEENVVDDDINKTLEKLNVIKDLTDDQPIFVMTKLSQKAAKRRKRPFTSCGGQPLVPISKTPFKLPEDVSNSTLGNIKQRPLTTPQTNAKNMNVNENLEPTNLQKTGRKSASNNFLKFFK